MCVCNSERIIKIGQTCESYSQMQKVQFFLTHSVDWGRKAIHFVNVPFFARMIMRSLVLTQYQRVTDGRSDGHDAVDLLLTQLTTQWMAIKRN